MATNYSENCGMMAKDDIPSDIKNPENAEALLEIRLYPNPATDRLYIALPSQTALEKITIYDMQGRVVTVSETTDLSVRDLPEGLYFAAIAVRNNNTIYHKKIAVSK